MQWWLIGLHGRDHGLGAARRVTWLVAADLGHVGARTTTGGGIIRNFVTGLYHRAAAKVGPEVARLDNGHMHAQRRNLLGQRLGETFDGEFTRAIDSPAGVSTKASNRRNV